MHGTSKCFFDFGTRVVDELSIACKLEIISPVALELEPAPSFTKAKLNLKEALEQDFALHIGEDSILIHEKTLWMSVCEKTYHKAGLPMKKIRNRYHLRIEVTAPLNRRFKWALDETLTDIFEFIIANGSATPAYNHGQFETPPMIFEEGEFDDWAPHFFEWTALVGLNSPALHAKQNPVICNYFSYPDSSMQLLHVYSIDGLITPNYVHQVLATNADWLIVTCHGFIHSPMAWKRPHHWDQGGEHGYTILKSNKEVYFKLVSRGDL